MKKQFAIISCVALLNGCNQHAGSNKTENVVAEELTIARDTLKSPLRPNEQITLGEPYTDTVEFINLNDDGDHALFCIRKEKDPISLIYDWHHEYNFIKGDQIEIIWKSDSIRYAGDPEFIDYTEFLVSARRLEPPKLTDKKIEFLWRETQLRLVKKDVSPVQHEVFEVRAN